MTKKKANSGVENQPRRGVARRMGEMLPDVGGTAFRRFGFVQSSIVSRWKEIVGDRYADVSAPESIRFPQGKRSNGVLTLVVAGAHAPMMQHVVPVIIERVNRFFGYAAVQKVTIRQGEVLRGPAPRPRVELVPLPVELGDSLRTIGDPELRAVLESLARGVATATQPAVVGRVK